MYPCTFFGLVCGVGNSKFMVLLASMKIACKYLIGERMSPDRFVWLFFRFVILGSGQWTLNGHEVTGRSNLTWWRSVRTQRRDWKVANLACNDLDRSHSSLHEMRYLILLILSLFVAGSLASIPKCDRSLSVGTTCHIHAYHIKPTQFAYGRVASQCKAQHLNSMSSSKLDSYLLKYVSSL